MKNATDTSPVPCPECQSPGRLVGTLESGKSVHRCGRCRGIDRHFVTTAEGRYGSHTAASMKAMLEELR